MDNILEACPNEKAVVGSGSGGIGQAVGLNPSELLHRVNGHRSFTVESDLNRAGAVGHDLGLNPVSQLHVAS